MKTSLLISALLLALAAVAPASADDPPPLPGGVKCKQHVKKTYRLSAIERNGIPFKVSCTGAATFFVQPELAAGTEARSEAYSLFPRGLPGITTVPKGRLAQAGTATVRPKLRPWAKRLLRRFPKTKLLVGLGTKRVDGTWWGGGPGYWSYTVVTR
jgi:hypothetical protein